MVTEILRQINEQLAARRNRPFEAQTDRIVKQRLSDGEVTTRTETTFYYRDSEGRERHEFSFEVQPGTVLRGATVYDYPNNIWFSLHCDTKTVGFKEPIITTGAWAEVWRAGEWDLYVPILPPSRLPDLGSKEMEGLLCDGYTVSEPGKYQVECWYSRDLNCLVFVKAEGQDKEITWQLRNIRRVQPDPSLFTIPPDYT